MKNIIKFQICLLILLIYSHPAFGEDKPLPVKHLEEIVGCWKRINFTPNEMAKFNKKEPWPLKYQWFCFYSNGDLKTMMATKDETPKENDLLNALSILPSPMRCSIPKQGIIYTTHKDTNEKLYWVSEFFSQDSQVGSQEIKKGTLLMTLRNFSSGQDVYYRFLERIK